MISYRTLLFGTIAIVAAAAPIAPALADSVPAVPLRTTMDSVPAVPLRPMDSVPAVPLTRPHSTSPTVSPRESFPSEVIETVLRFEQMLLRIAL